MESGTFTLDVSGLASCYNTAAGVGIHAQVADTGERKKGLHWSIGVALVVGLVLLVGFAAPNVIASMFKTAPPVKMEKRAEQRGAAQGQSRPVEVQTNHYSSTVSKLEVVKEVETNYCKGYAYIPATKDCKVLMSDGRELSLRKGEVQQIHETYVLINGKRFQIKAEKPR